MPNLPLPTPVKFNRLLNLLSGYNHSTVTFLSCGFTHGFPLHFDGERRSSQAKNLLSAQHNPEAVDAKIAKELAAGRLAGPFQSPPISPFIVSPLGVVPKKSPGEFRLIHHLSFPKGSSVNYGISHYNSMVQYATIGDVITCMKLAGKGCYLAKTDIQNAFLIIPIQPDDYGLLCMQWRGSFYLDSCMPMGCASSCRTFEIFSTADEWLARHKLKIDHIIHLLDDFLIIAPDEQLCQAQLDLFIDLCSYVGIPIAPEKTCGPFTTLSFAGIERVSVFQEACLPPEKICKCSLLISAFLGRKKVTLRELKSLTGLLNFACSIVVPGRAFLCRLIDLTIGIHLIRLSREVKEYFGGLAVISV